MDSKLVIEQMAGRWKVRHEGLRPLALEAAALARRLRVTWTWIPRERNTHADRLANEAMDAAARGETWRPGPAASAPQSPPPTGPGVGPGGDAAGGLAGSGGVAGADDRGGHGWMPGATRTATSLLLLRHGQTPLSIEKRFSGLGDPELTPTGLAQAEAAAARLARRQRQVEVVVTSPLTRARQTAEVVASRTGSAVLVDEDLRETDFGAWEGYTFAEIQRRWPGELAAWLADPGVAPPGGESFASTARRVEQARERILKAHESRSVVVVSHVTPIKTLIRFALGAPPEALYRMHLDVACLSAIDYYADGPSVVRTVNDTAHLG